MINRQFLISPFFYILIVGAGEHIFEAVSVFRAGNAGSFLQLLAHFLYNWLIPSKQHSRPSRPIAAKKATGAAGVCQRPDSYICRLLM